MVGCIYIVLGANYHFHFTLGNMYLQYVKGTFAISIEACLENTNVNS